MPLQLNTVSIPLAQGIDTKTDPKQLTLGRLTDIRNLEFNEVGDLSPRNGYAALTQNIVNSGSIGVGVTLATLNSSLVELDGTNIYSYAESLGKWAAKGEKIAVSLSTFPVNGAATNATVQDSALHSSGAAIYTWIDSIAGTMSYSVTDTSTQATIVQQGGGYSATNAKPCVISTNSSFTVFLQNAGNLQYTSVTLANPASSTSPSTLVTLTSGSAPFDACTGSLYGYIFYVNSGGDIAVSRINTSNAVVNTVTLTGQSATSMTCWYDTTNNYVWLFWYSGTAIKYAVYTSALVSVLATTTALTAENVTRLTGAFTIGTTSTVWYERMATASTNDYDDFLAVYTLTAAGVATLVTESPRSLSLAGKAFTYGGVTYAIAVHDSELQPTYFLMRPTGFNSYAEATVVGKLAPLNAGGTPVIKTLGNTYATATGKYAFAYLLRANPTTLSGVVQSTKVIQSATFDFTQSPRKLALANNLHLTGAILTNYDSGSSTEHGFNLFPEGGSQANVALLGGLGIGSVSYKFTYEWIDELGQTHRSAPSVGLQADIGPTTGSTRDGGDTTTVIVDGGTHITAPGMELTGLVAGVYAANTFITGVINNAEVDVSPADAGPVFVTPTSFHSRRLFVVSSGYAGYANDNQLLIAGDLSVLYFTTAITNGSAQIFAAITKGLVVGQTIADNESKIPGGTTISSFVYKNNGAFITMSAAATATQSPCILHITHASAWPVSSWLHSGQGITGTSIPSDTVITAVNDTTSVITLSESVTAQITAGNAIVKNAYQSKLVLPTLRITEKGRITQPAQIAVWRTPTDGTQYYKVGFAVNDTTVDSVVFYDYTSDDDLVGNTPLYTNGGEVENIAPPATDIITSYKNRVILVPSEDRLTWWYSKQVIEGTPVEFSDSFVQSIDQRGGNIAAVTPLDDKLIFLKANDLFYVAGDGPAPSGANNDFSYPQVITSPCGCSEPKSVITIPVGIIFKSAKGYYLLDRGLNVSYIGSEVEDYNSLAVTSAVHLATGTQVRFTVTGGLVLVYDYYVKQWSVFDSIAATDAVIYNNNYTYLTAGGLVLEETPGLYSDNGAVITSSFKTGWISFDKVQNFQRLYATLLVGQYFSPHTLTYSIAQNFVTVPTQTATVTLTSAIDAYQLRFPTIRQKCEAAQLTFSCVPASTAGQGAAFSNLMFEMGIKMGAFKMPAVRTYGGSAT